MTYPDQTNEIYTLLDGVTSDTTGAATGIVNQRRNQYGMGQLKIASGTPSVAIYGRIDSTMNWGLITTLTDEVPTLIALMPEMYADATSVTGATTCKLRI